MALKIRLARAGSKKRPYYHVVVADARAPRDGRFIETIGAWNPLLAKGAAERVKIDGDKAKAWIAKGAQPTDRVLRFLDEAGVAKREARVNPKKAEIGTKAKERIAMAEKKAADAALNRLTYGPTPDELERVTAIGPQAFIDEQLNMEALAETMDETPPGSVQTINSVPPENQVKTEWINVRLPGRFSNTNLYMYLTSPGEAYVDDIALYAGTGTNINFSVNYVQNGDFESALSGPWTVSDNHTNSAIVTDVKCSGAASLHLVATTGGSTQGSSIWQTVAPGLTSNQTCTLSFWYLPRTNSSIITLRSIKSKR